MKMVKLLLVGATVSMLAACGKPGELETGIAQAERLGDPYESALVLSNALASLEPKTVTEFLINYALDRSPRDPIEEYDHVQSLMGEYLVKAVERGDKRAMPLIFQQRLPDSVLERSAPFVMEQAALPDASPEVLLAAARLTLDGRQVQMDLQQSFTLLTRSWALDQQPLTAVYGREIFLKLQDGPNAYLWSLRSLKEGRWPGAWFENERSPAEKVEIQRQAHNPKLYLVAPSPLKPFEG
ncbi:hypothetical protein [Pseudomonas amygdali]|uniref:Lipoprotein n=2 Tax=Pseudomonas amygdali pv. lachrymans TaxID=53707 RepID=A0ABR5KTK5_PSEAV|nr:hypothetical protein [Pseudomonas amygdali]AXH59622.1 hypothetical protein PLA107_030835 [Pseudomonas amygdali pv. lachrymans str. M301315]KPC17052.1 Uncharacterized protein AC499_0254 [Pseudomonas amygdali pv. lachrymans]KPC18011.1 Uncharacterized protein AC499_1213 [Pseudomonas amygdali pv. lachrymans]RMT06257.1 hypothetical protein ALP54_03541 [Pseudomonas amygdali pv. lachrymans]